ncbi:MAG: hypothetical protein K8W52_29765 [Deltaproteobacteria bacterium]|nr:hypothetical protein [Deltaproteobacteria bacterium]
MTRWQRYWFAPGSRQALASLRIAIAIALGLTLWLIGTGPDEVDRAARARLYHPVGLLHLLGGAPPPAALLAALQAIAWTAVAAMLVGYRARAATGIAVVAAILLAAHAEAFTPSWSHTLNAPLLAGVALLGARTGEAYAIDAWLAARRGAVATDPLTVAPLRRVQLAVGLMFASAALIKLASSHFTLDWALSDNLRNQIVARFDMQGARHTAAADWLLAAPWRWQLAALFNLACQLSPLVAIASPGRPRLRAVCGGLFVMEVLLLGIVMGLWNPQWLPLAAAFVDWDWVRARRPVGPIAVAAPTRGARIWAAAFALVLVTTSLAPAALSQRLWLYPCTNYPMFSSIRAAHPYGEHLPYRTVGQQIEVLIDPPLTSAQQDRIDGENVYRRFFRLRDPAALRDALAVIVGDAHVRYPQAAIRGARLWLVEQTVPAYPAVARVESRRIGVVAELDGDAFRTVPGTIPGTPPEHLVVAGEAVTVTTVVDARGVARAFAQIE